LTFSIVARLPDAELFGLAIVSSSPAVGARCAHGRSGVGVVATQNITDPGLAPRVLDGLQGGLDARSAVQHALAATPYGAYRQLLALGRSGPPCIHTGACALGVTGEAAIIDAAAAGNLLAHRAVPTVMIGAFEAASGHLAERLLEGVGAGLAAGGEAGPVHSAALLVMRDVEWPIVDLRVDWSDDDPVAALGALWRRYAPQIEDYVQRALDPTRASSFGVPGDP
jgi:uncharacterized Ntn-hydrolase superfamily protein